MIIKAILICGAIVVAHAGAIRKSALANTGVSTSTIEQDTHGNYGFEYDIHDGAGGTNSRSEVGDGHGNKKGAYTIRDIDGRARRVDYVADEYGFRAVVKTNEPGTALSNPAAAVINSPNSGPSDPASSRETAAPVEVVQDVVVAAPVAIHQGSALDEGYGYDTYGTDIGDGVTSSAYAAGLANDGGISDGGYVLREVAVASDIGNAAARGLSNEGYGLRDAVVSDMGNAARGRNNERYRLRDTAVISEAARNNERYGLRDTAVASNVGNAARNNERYSLRDAAVASNVGNAARNNERYSLRDAAVSNTGNAARNNERYRIQDAAAVSDTGNAVRELNKGARNNAQGSRPSREVGITDRAVLISERLTDGSFAVGLSYGSGRGSLSYSDGVIYGFGKS